MKKVIFLFMLICCINEIKALEPLIKFYLQDGSEKVYKIVDIDELSFIKSKATTYLTIYRNNYSKNVTFDAQFIEKMNFVSNNSILKLFNNGQQFNFSLSNIDSITFKEILLSSLDTVKICNQIWMTKNLEVNTYRNGDTIRYAASIEDWIDAGKKMEGAWCYYHYNPANGVFYGKLYNWYAIEDPRGFVPEGWHIPSQEEWTELENCLGGNEVAGGKIKTTGTIEDGTGLWLSPNEGATNESSFSALPGGYLGSYGHFFSLSSSGFFWSSSVEGKYQTCIFINHNDSRLNRGFSWQSNGFSVRCVRD